MINQEGFSRLCSDVKCYVPQYTIGAFFSKKQWYNFQVDDKIKKDPQGQNVEPFCCTQKDILEKMALLPVNHSPVQNANQSLSVMFASQK